MQNQTALKTFVFRWIESGSDHSEVLETKEYQFKNLEEAATYAQSELLENILENDSGINYYRMVYNTEYFDKESGEVVEDFDEFDEGTMDSIDFILEIEEEEV